MSLSLSPTYVIFGAPFAGSELLEELAEELGHTVLHAKKGRVMRGKAVEDWPTAPRLVVTADTLGASHADSIGLYGAVGTYARRIVGWSVWLRRSGAITDTGARIILPPLPRTWPRSCRDWGGTPRVQRPYRRLVIPPPSDAIPLSIGESEYMDVWAPADRRYGSPNDNLHHLRMSVLVPDRYTYLDPSIPRPGDAPGAEWVLHVELPEHLSPGAKIVAERMCARYDASRVEYVSPYAEEGAPDGSGRPQELTCATAQGADIVYAITWGRHVPPPNTAQWWDIAPYWGACPVDQVVIDHLEAALRGMFGGAPDGEPLLDDLSADMAEVRAEVDVVATGPSPWRWTGAGASTPIVPTARDQRHEIASSCPGIPSGAVEQIVSMSGLDRHQARMRAVAYAAITSVGERHDLAPEEWQIMARIVGAPHGYDHYPWYEDWWRSPRGQAALWATLGELLAIQLTHDEDDDNYRPGWGRDLGSGRYTVRDRDAWDAAISAVRHSLVTHLTSIASPPGAPYGAIMVTPSDDYIHVSIEATIFAAIAMRGADADWRLTASDRMLAMAHASSPEHFAARWAAVNGIEIPSGETSTRKDRW